MNQRYTSCVAEPSYQLERGKRNRKQTARATLQFVARARRSRFAAIAMPAHEVKGLRKHTQNARNYPFSCFNNIKLLKRFVINDVIMSPNIRQATQKRLACEILPTFLIVSFYIEYNILTKKTVNSTVSRVNWQSNNHHETISRSSKNTERKTF